MATADIAASAGTVVVTQTGIQGIPWVAFKTGRGQIAKVPGRQQGGVVALRTVHPLFNHMCSMFPGSCGIVLTRVGGVALLAITGDIHRTVKPVERGLTAMAACRAAGLVDIIIAGPTALGIVGGSKGNAGRVASVEMKY